MNVGDYVKFKDKRGNTYIRQIKDLPQDIRYGAIKIDIEANYSDMLSPKNVIKSSPNIINLIEVGDILMIKDMFGNVSKVEVDEDFKLLSDTIEKTQEKAVELGVEEDTTVIKELLDVISSNPNNIYIF